MKKQIQTFHLRDKLLLLCKSDMIIKINPNLVWRKLVDLQNEIYSQFQFVKELNTKALFQRYNQDNNQDKLSRVERKAYSYLNRNIRLNDQPLMTILQMRDKKS